MFFSKLRRKLGKFYNFPGRWVPSSSKVLINGLFQAWPIAYFLRAITNWLLKLADDKKKLSDLTKNQASWHVIKTRSNGISIIIDYLPHLYTENWYLRVVYFTIATSFYFIGHTVYRLNWIDHCYPIARYIHCLFMSRCAIYRLLTLFCR